LYIYIYRYIHAYISIYVYIYILIYMYADTHTHIYIYIHLHICIYIYTYCKSKVHLLQDLSCNSHLRGKAISINLSFSGSRASLGCTPMFLPHSSHQRTLRWRSLRTSQNNRCQIEFYFFKLDCSSLCQIYSIIIQHIYIMALCSFFACIFIVYFVKFIGFIVKNKLYIFNVL
jgi:hypothetical protein